MQKTALNLPYLGHGTRAKHIEQGPGYGRPPRPTQAFPGVHPERGLVRGRAAGSGVGCFPPPPPTPIPRQPTHDQHPVDLTVAGVDGPAPPRHLTVRDAFWDRDLQCDVSGVVSPRTVHNSSRPHICDLSVGPPGGTGAVFSQDDDISLVKVSLFNTVAPSSCSKPKQYVLAHLAGRQCTRQLSCGCHVSES